MRSRLDAEEPDEIEEDEDGDLTEEQLVEENLYLCGLLNQVLERACAVTGLPMEFFTAMRQ